MNDEILSLLINLLCVLLIILSMVSVVGLGIAIFKADFISYMISQYFGKAVEKIYLISNNFWMLFYILLGSTSVMVLKRKDFSRKLIILLSSIGIVVFYAQLILMHFLTTEDSGRFALLNMFQNLTGGLILFIIVIFVFVHPKVKEMFE